ncbi:MAG TPA: DUF5695 domain-containing protein [Terriglobales bacterium]|nr:DUF5695 domain-containing protein [Terriglobales bacterium]
MKNKEREHLRSTNSQIVRWFLFFAFLCAASANLSNAQESQRKTPPTPGPMLNEGTITVSTPDFSLVLVKSSQTVAALNPKAAPDFDFTPGDLLTERSQNGYFHLGDITLRLRSGDSGDWKNYSTATERTPVKALPTPAHVLASADLSSTLPSDIPLQVVRTWALENGKLTLRFTLKNKSDAAVEIGALGIPMIFNNVLNNRSLEEAHAKCSFYDPYIGEDAGYLQVTRLSGKGPALLVVPDGKTPFEAYNPILDHPNRWGAKPVFTDPTPRGITFEGFYEWMVHSQSYAENEWKGVDEWNPATAVTLKPGESKTYGVRFLLSDSIRNIENTLATNQRPVAVGFPDYVLPTDIDGRLFLKYSRRVKSLAIEPQGALSLQRLPNPGHRNWAAYAVKGQQWGRSRLTVTYDDGLVQTIHYFVTKPESEVVSDMGHFLTTTDWFADPNDPFHRSPSVMTYNREQNKIVMQDSRAWIAGLGDEGGGGGWIAAMMKEFVQPNKEEIDKLQQFIDGVVWGGLQYKDGEHKYGVRKSLFYYQPDELPAGFYRSDFDWSSWTSWNKKASEQVDRSYDYPHVAAAYWVMYHLARNNQGLVINHPWDWYLNQAYETSIAMTKYAEGLAVFGQMEGSIFLQILTDLRREGMNDKADDLEAKMRARADRWKREPYPFGSEMPWDSTGQEEVYDWTKYFGYNDKAEVTLNAILGYDPAIPHWGYNGSARRYWDFIFAGGDRRLERQLHHYGSSLNAIPLLAEYREHPDDVYLLRVGYGGTMGALTDIDQEGFPAAAFHSFPDMLKDDPITGDYGPNFFGHSWNTATYVVNDPQFGWVAFGGNLKKDGNTIDVTPLDSSRTRIYVAPYGLWLTLDAGTFAALELDPTSSAVRIGFSASNQFSSEARLRIDQPAKLTGVSSFRPTTELKSERQAYVIPLKATVTWVELSSKTK